MAGLQFFGGKLQRQEVMQAVENPSGKKRGRPVATDTPAFFKRQATVAKSMLRKRKMVYLSGPKGCTKIDHNDVYAPSLI